MPAGKPEWVGVFYPDDTPTNSRSKVIACLFFDRVVCIFPVNAGAGYPCSAEGISDLALGDSPLSEAGVLEAREEALWPEIVVNQDTPAPWGSTADEFDLFYKLQVTTTAMRLCGEAEEGLVPVTDDPNWKVPASLLESVDITRYAHLQAAALASGSLDIALPPLADITDEEILQLRDDLKEQLIPFRLAMLRLAPAVRGAVSNNASLGDVSREAEYIVETHVGPSLNEFQLRLRKEKGRFWRRIFLKTGLAVPKVVLNWVTRGALQAAAAALTDAKSVASDIIDRNRLQRAILDGGGLGYLLSVSDHPIVIRRSQGQSGKLPGHA